MLKQIVDVAFVGLRSIRWRIGAAMVTVVGTAGVVGVLCGLFALASGLEEAARNTARGDRGVVLRDGAQLESMSYYSGDAVGKLLQIDEIVSASGELLFHIQLPDRRSDDALVMLRSVDSSWREIRPEIRIVKGRAFIPGKREVVVGRRLLAQYPAFALGSLIPIYQTELAVVGVFTADGSMDESAMFADIEVLRDVYKRGNAVNTVRVVLSDATAEAQVQRRLHDDPEANVKLVMETKLFEEHIRERRNLIAAFAYWVVGIMCVGAVVASLSTMYNAVNSRIREIATLRALGFGRTVVVGALLIEAIFLALVGAVCGALVVYLLFDNVETATRSGLNTTLVFAFRVDGRIILWSMVLALAVGGLGGLAAGVRAVRLPLTSALRR